MKVITPEDKIVKSKNSVFLAGTTPKNRKKDWRKQIISILQNKGFNGIIINPDYTELTNKLDYEAQIMWEIKAMKSSCVVAFWIDRDMPKRPGLTTNVEFGYWLRSDKVVYGRPETSEKCFYLDYTYKLEQKKKHVLTLEQLADEIIKKLTKV